MKYHPASGMLADFHATQNQTDLLILEPYSRKRVGRCPKWIFHMEFSQKRLKALCTFSERTLFSWVTHCRCPFNSNQNMKKWLKNVEPFDVTHFKGLWCFVGTIQLYMSQALRLWYDGFAFLQGNLKERQIVVEKKEKRCKSLARVSLSSPFLCILLFFFVIFLEFCKLGMEIYTSMYPRITAHTHMHTCTKRDC